MSNYKPDPMFNDPTTEPSHKTEWKITIVAIVVVAAVVAFFYFR